MTMKRWIIVSIIPIISGCIIQYEEKCAMTLSGICTVKWQNTHQSSAFGSVKDLFNLLTMQIHSPLLSLAYTLSHFLVFTLINCTSASAPNVEQLCYLHVIYSFKQCLNVCLIHVLKDEGLQDKQTFRIDSLWKMKSLCVFLVYHEAEK